MKIVYLFREYGVVRVPFLSGNPSLFNSFILGGGRWDSNSQMFIFNIT
jgi:hypothetical protein